jgi:PLD-like domain
MNHDIIDNRKEKLVDHINRILSSTESARFAVGYFFLSGLESIAHRLAGVKELRLLIGNTTNRETVEQLAEGYRRLELVAEAAEAEAYPKRTDTKRITGETAGNIRSAIELMDQTDEAQAVVTTLVRMVEEKRLKVKIYTKGRLHAKAYIFDYGKVFDKSGKPVERHENGLAIIGSSNLTLSGVTHNTELNVLVQGNDNHAELGKWFDELWDESQDFDEALMQEMKQSWAVASVRPYDIYMKTLYALVRDRLEGEDDKDILWDDEITKRLADFQKVAVRQAVQMLKDYGGAFVADVVGLGKSYIGAAIVKHFERTDHTRALIICPAPLVEMWERYDEVYQLNARVLSMGFLREEDDGAVNFLLDNILYKDRDFVLIDESHNLRHRDTQRYKVVEAFLSTGRRCCLLTATPRNKSAWDVYSQIKLFHQDDKTDLPIDPPDLKQYFKLIEDGERNLPDLLANILIRRTRNHILRWYGFDSVTHQQVDPSQFRDYLDGRKRAYVLVGGRHQFFPKRTLDTIEYSIEDTYQGLYQQLRGYLGKSKKGKSKKDVSASTTGDELKYARYGLHNYVQKEKQKREPYASLHRAGYTLRGLMLDANGAVVSKDIPRILGAIKCGPELNSQPLPKDYNAAVMSVQRQFAEEVKHRQAERTHTLSLSHGQNYVLRELRVLFGASTDEDQKAIINLLEKSFRGPITRAVNREVVLLRRNGVSGEPLLKALSRIYDQHNLRDWVDRRGLHATARPVPKIVCSEALV